jgi:hypothetical protein
MRVPSKWLLPKNLVFFSVIGTIVAMIFMAASFLFPHPLMLVLAMSVGQLIAILSLALFLLAVGLDLQGSGAYYLEEEPAAETPPETPEPPAQGSPSA